MRNTTISGGFRTENLEEASRVKCNVFSRGGPAAKMELILLQFEIYRKEITANHVLRIWWGFPGNDLVVDFEIATIIDL